MREYCSTLETENQENQLRFLDLYHLSEKEEQELKQEVEKASGCVRIFVHPFYSLHSEFFHVSPTVQKQMSDGLQRILELDDPDKTYPPIILFESVLNIENTKNILSGFKSKRKVYFVSTFDGSSEINENFRRKPYYSIFNENKINKEYDSFVNILKDLSVAKIILGGQLLRVFKGKKNWFLYIKKILNPSGLKRMNDYLKANPHVVESDGSFVFPDLCVGYLYTVLSPFFNIDFSAIVAPTNRIKANKKLNK